MIDRTPQDPFAHDVALHDAAARMRQKEDEIGVDPLVLLHAEIEQLKPRHQALAGRYADMRVWEQKAKSLRSVYMIEHRNTARANGTKMTNDEIEQQGYADPRYISFLETAEAEKAEYEWLTVQIQNIREKINRGQAILRAHAAERYTT